jgi:putative selenate reductase
MSDRMRPVPFRELVLRCLAECRAAGSIFDIPEAHFWKSSGGKPVRIFSSGAANPVGPAAGPHTQLAQNIVAAWCAGGRYIELKTVQKLDSLAIDKPCIDAADEGYNVEWSTELSLDEAYDEYLKAWMLLHFLETLLGHSGPTSGASSESLPSFLFNMSVGYDLEGIRTEKMDRFISRLIDSTKEPLFGRYQEDLAAIAANASLLAGTVWQSRAEALRALPSRIPPRLCSSVTLSTMHGCPPGEIESICTYMLREKRLDTLVKLNPTLLGFERAQSILAGLGYGYVGLKPEGFLKDLQYQDALPMLSRLMDLGRQEGRHFGAKLSNTLAATNAGKALPGAEMYMSGRALYPLAMTLAASLAADFKGSLPLSFSGGVSAWNLAGILDAGIRPVTVATELLKPGGYARMKELAEISEACRASGDLPLVDVEKTRRAADAAVISVTAQKDFRGTSRVAVPGALPLFDCFVAPCVHTCPIHQDVPEYVHLAGSGRFADALEAVWLRNPLPFMTGYLCDHQCMQNCTRMDWEGAVRIRDIKRISAELGYDEFRSRRRQAAGRVAKPRGVKIAVIGAGPAGIAGASFLCAEGFEVHVFEREKEAAGIVRYLLPGFRIPAGAAEKDVQLLLDAGAHIHFEHPGQTIRELMAQGFPYVLVGIGAEADRDIGIPGAREVLSFLREFRHDPRGLRLGRNVVVVGAGDTAMDAARAARGCPGVEQVRIVYRRSLQEMPASREEYESAVEEGVAFSFLRAPERWDTTTGLLCRVMDLGPVDQTGRPRPVPTDRTETFAADTVITAAGSDVDAAAMERLGLGRRELPINPRTQETGIHGVFLVGDAAQGPETIVKAIASARRAADAILEREAAQLRQERKPGSAARQAPVWPLPLEDTRSLRAARDRLVPASTGAGDALMAATESKRCLGCRALCVKCVEVCPNRANTLVRVKAGFRDEAQIVHIDAFCNECGNCATFCPWEGKPYRDKLTIFATAEDFRDSTNPGFFLGSGAGQVRTGGREGPLEVDAEGRIGEWSADMEKPVRDLISAIVRDHAWLLGGAS